MTFDEWLDEVEVFSTREERLESDFPVLCGSSFDKKRLLGWLRAAYDVGHDEGQSRPK
jgi:hypothetical protein